MRIIFTSHDLIGDFYTTVNQIHQHYRNSQTFAVINEKKKKKQDNKIKGKLKFRDMCNDADLDDEGVRGILQSLRKPIKDENVKKAYYEMVEKLREKVQETMRVFNMDYKSQ